LYAVPVFSFSIFVFSILISFLGSSTIDFSFVFNEKESKPVPHFGQNFTLSNISSPQLGQNLGISFQLCFVAI